MPFLPVELETASEAPRSAQTGPCRAFLRSGVHPPPLSHLPLLSPPSSPHPVLLASYLCFAHGHLFLCY